MATSRVKTNLFLTFEIAAKWQYVCVHTTILQADFFKSANNADKPKVTLNGINLKKQEAVYKFEL